LNEPMYAPPPLPSEAIAVAAAIDEARKPLITSHIRLDGDAIGAALGLGHILMARGIAPHLVFDSALPEAYSFLPGADTIATSVDALRDDYDLVIALDIPTRSRARKVFDGVRESIPVIAIDHHPIVTQLGSPEWKDPTRSSTGEMIAHLALETGWQISAEAATCLYTSIITDTGRLSFPNTTPCAMHIAADLIQLGAAYVDVCDAVYGQEPYNLMELRAEAMADIRLHASGNIAVMRVPFRLLQEQGVDPMDTGELADIPRTIRGVEVGVLLREMESGKIKASLRSRKGVNIEPVARQFGGGGHRQAAGCEVEGTLDEAERTIANALCAQLGLEDDGDSE
jgi:bifunctional oligoribonuclease and PAP phosphatase NrnA